MQATPTPLRIQGTRADRNVRLFVSSTFRDMRPERDRLAHFVFPELRRRLGLRDLNFCEIDLRWGITTEEAEDGRILQLCLAEIERCLPFQICLLGERYGWIDPKSHEKLSVLAPRLTKFADRSVTELEIRHGILNAASATRPECFFYLRAAEYVDRLPDGIDRSDYRPESPEAAAKLAALKAEIRASGHPVREGYRTSAELGELVMGDLSATIERLFPPETGAVSGNRVAERQARLIARATLGYVSRHRQNAALDRHALSDGAPLLIEGSTGIGKSALLAHWLSSRLTGTSQTSLSMPSSWRRRLRLWFTRLFASQSLPGQIHQVSVFAGATGEVLGDTDMAWATVLDRLLYQLKAIADIDAPIPASLAELPQTFARWIALAAARGRIVVVLDGLDEVLTPDGPADLDWLPEILPAGAQLVVSAGPGKLAELLAARGWHRLAIVPMSRPERTALTKAYLGEFGKRLSSDGLTSLVGAEQTSNPLYLRTVLEQVRQVGVHETLSVQLGDYLAAGDLPEVFDRLLAHLEAMHSADLPGLVESTLALLVSARRGLTEAELLDLIGDAGTRLPARLWSPLGIALEPHLLRVEGVLIFLTKQMRDAVERRYLASEPKRTVLQRRLADYFESRRYTARAVEELPWLLASLASWDELAHLLTDPGFLPLAWRKNPFHLSMFWTLLMAKSKWRPADAYAATIETETDEAGAVIVSQLLADLGCLEEALRIGEKLIGRLGAKDDVPALVSALAAQGASLLGAKRFTEARPLIERQLALCESQGNDRRIALALDNLALVTLHSGAADRALALLLRAEALHKAAANDLGLAVNLGNQAVALHRANRTDEALALWRRQESLSRRVGDARSLSASLGNQARALAERGRLEEATALHLEEERLCRQINDLWGLQISLGNQALVRLELGHIDDAVEATERREGIAQRLGDPSGQIMALCQRAQAFERLGELRVADTYRRQALTMADARRDTVWPSEVTASLAGARRGLLDRSSG